MTPQTKASTLIAEPDPRGYDLPHSKDFGDRLSDTRREFNQLPPSEQQKLKQYLFGDRIGTLAGVAATTRREEEMAGD